MKRIAAFVILWILLPGLLVGCGSAAGKSRSEEQVLVVGGRDNVRTLDSGFLLKEQAQITETLVDIDENYQLKPVLASAWKQKDANTWEIKLKEGIQFHNQRKLTSQDVVFSLERAVKQNPQIKSLLQVKSIAAADEQTINLQTEKPNLLLMEVLASADLGILSRQSCNEKGELVQPIGTGPFKFSAWDQAGGEVVVVRNEQYRGGAPRLAKMIFKPIPDANTRALALEKGDIDFTFDLPYGELDRLAKVPGIRIELYPEPRIYRLEVNMSKQPFSDLKIRKAINYAVNREEIIKKALHGCGVPAIGPFLPDMPWTSQEAEQKYKYDAQKARALLAEAGWADSNGDGVLDKGGKAFDIKIMTWSSRPGMPPMAEVLQEQLKHVGIKVSIEVLDYGAIYDRVKEGNWECVLASFQSVDPQRYLAGVYGTGGSQNSAGYSNPQVDKLIDLTGQTSESAKRFGIYRQIQEIVGEDAPVINIASYKMAVGAREDVKGFKFNPQAHDLHTSPGMYIAK